LNKYHVFEKSQAYYTAKGLPGHPTFVTVNSLRQIDFKQASGMINFLLETV